MANPNPSYKIPKGTTPNPNGRPPKEWTMRGLIKEALEEQDEDGIPFKKKVVQKLRTLALRGDMSALKELNNRIDGMPMQPTDITTGGDKLEIVFTKGKIDPDSDE